MHSEPCDPNLGMPEQPDPTLWTGESRELPGTEGNIPHQMPPGTSDRHTEPKCSSLNTTERGQDSENTVYKLRNRTVTKSYAVHTLKTNRTLNHHVPNSDQENQLLECGDMDTLQARKRAWRTHFASCEKSSCEECEGWLKVRNARLIPNQKAYSECLIDVDKINVRGRKPAKIKFSTEPVLVKPVRRYLPVNLYSLSLAT